MSYKRIEDLLVWQESKALVVEIHGLFKDSRDFSFRDQIQRASIADKQFDHGLLATEKISKMLAGFIKKL